MKFSELKSNALNTIQPHKEALYKGAGVVLLGWFLFLIAALILQNKGMKDAADNVTSLRGLLLYPIILANIAMVARIYQGETVQASDALKNYSSLTRFGKALWAYILPTLYIFLWILPIIIFMVIFPRTDIGLLISSDEIVTKCTFAILVILLFRIIIGKSLQYGLNAYILGDNPNMSVNESIALSKELTKGYLIKFFLLSLSFIGWALLILPTLGLILIWLIPYYNATVYEFYNHLKRENAEENKNVSDNESVSTDETTDAE
ncbi:DUF975 family protein [Bacillus cereus group sp. TH152-1LC]|uniref:DUF975 family protein n=1 Tax=Bacillus cereus group sp. TH152-1LC TaxID=3018060 RepID=UPI0022E16AF8|nr:DUF975 family protein [Bacillus cereus group sp. TH152-1LC]MDA1675640.1 DUF975 family protein [Bacillus cereus group sp. TH152-1LC]